jgi:hypothetical protein
VGGAGGAEAGMIWGRSPRLRCPPIILVPLEA